MLARVVGVGVRGGVNAQVPAPSTPKERKRRRLMAAAAVWAELASRDAVVAAGWDDPLDDVGQWMGVGASGGDIDQLRRMLAASRPGGTFSELAFGDAGLRACNPLFAFQLMNNFQMCHAAIALGIGGPNAAYFSRGAQTARAFVAALDALQDGACSRCLVGGTDDLAHPVTAAKLRIAGSAGSGAAVLALDRKVGAEGVWITRAELGAPHESWPGFDGPVVVSGTGAERVAPTFREVLPSDGRFDAADLPRAVARAVAIAREHGRAAALCADSSGQWGWVQLSREGEDV
jgi:hypothetical protein